MKRSFRNRTGLALIVLLMLAAAAWAAGTGNDWNGRKAKYVFMFIGDGLGLQQVNAAEVYNGSVNRTGGEPAIKKLALSGLPVQGMITTYSTNSFITDSAPAATSLAAGHKTDNGVIGMDPAKKQKFTTVAQMVRAKGMKVGVLTSVSLNHATPAAFYASVPSRNDYYGIGEQLIDSGFDFFAGGGLHQSTGKEKDRKDLYEIAKEKGYQVLRTREDILSAKPGTKVIAVNPVLDGSNAMPYDMDRTDKELSLAEFTRKGIEMLHNPEGFFLMVEGGKIDWACHANDAAAAIGDTFAFDAAVREALAFAEKHPDETLIIVVGDHETGGMSIGFAGTQYETFFEKIAHQKESYEAFDRKIAAFRKESEKTFEKMMPLITGSFGLRTATAEERAALEEKARAGDDEARIALSMTLSELELGELRAAFENSMLEKKERAKDEATFLLYGGYEPLSVKITHILNRKAGIGWTSYAHTGIPVPLFAAGLGSELFAGYYDNTDVAWKTMSILGVR